MEQTENINNPQLEEIYLKNRIKKRKINLLIVSIVTFLLAVAIIIMACVNVDLRPKFVTDPDKVVIYTTELPSGQISLDESSEEYANFQKVYNVKPIFLCAGQGYSRHCPPSCSSFPINRSVAAFAI